MKILLDTHTFLWFIMGDTRISAESRRLIEDTNNEKLVSLASLWEMAIKLNLGKLSLAGSFEAIIPNQIKLNGFELLNIEVSHITAVSTLPQHHRDPFDRMLVAQCKVERLPILSADIAFDSYLLNRLW